MSRASRSGRSRVRERVSSVLAARRGAGEPVYPEPRRTAVVVQVEPLHEFYLPALVHVLRANGVQPRVLLNERVREERPGLLGRHPEIADHVRFASFDGFPAMRAVARRVQRLDPDVLVMNTFQFDGPSRWLHFWEGPMLGIVHNLLRMLDSPQSMDLVRAGRIGLLTMAPHVTGELLARDPRLYATTASLSTVGPGRPRVDRVRRPPRGVRRVTVPGVVDLTARDYVGVLESLPRVLREVPPGSLELLVLGAGPGRAELERLARERGLAEHVRFAGLNDQGFVPGGTFSSLLQGSTFLLPAVPLEPAPYADYRSVRVTTAVQDSLTYEVPAVLDHWTATVYDVPAVRFTGDDVAAGLVRAATVDPEELAHLRARLVRRRRHEVERSVAEMGLALSALGL